MSSVVRYLENSQIGVRRKNKNRKFLSTLQLNCDFLFERLSSTNADVYTFDDDSVHAQLFDVPPFVCKFRKDSCNDNDILAVAMEEGDVSLLSSKNGYDKLLLHNWKAHHNAIFDLCWLPDKPAIITGSGDNTVALWDVVSCKNTQMYRNHLGSVKCVDVCPRQSAILASGSRDGDVNVWDTRVNKSAVCEKPELVIAEAHSPSSGEENVKRRNYKSPHLPLRIRSVTSVSFQDENHLASAGVGDQNVKIWDMRKIRSSSALKKGSKVPLPKHSLFYPGDGCTSVTFDSIYKNLYACCTNNTIYQYDCHSYNSLPVLQYSGLKVATYFIKMALSPDDNYILCGSSDDNAYIWKVSSPGSPIYTLMGHTAEVTAVAWHASDVTKLATCGDDNHTVIWKVRNPSEMAEKKYLFWKAKAFKNVETIVPSLPIDDSDTGSECSPSPKSSATKTAFKTISEFFHRHPLSPERIILRSANDPAATPPSSRKRKSFDSGNTSRPALVPKRILNNENTADPCASTNISPKRLKESPTANSSGEIADNGDLKLSSPVPMELVSAVSRLSSSPSNAKTPPPRKRIRSARTPKSSRKRKGKPSERPITSYFQGTP